LNDGLIDEMHFVVSPVVLGEGTPIFSQEPKVSQKFIDAYTKKAAVPLEDELFILFIFKGKILINLWHINIEECIKQFSVFFSARGSGVVTSWSLVNRIKLCP
jgi:hypothetical protein